MGVGTQKRLENPPPKRSMSDVQAILTRAQRLGLHLQVEGERIAIAPARLCPPELLATIREHKPEVMPCWKRAPIICRLIARRG